MGAMRWTEEAVVVMWVNSQDRSSNGGDEKRAVAMEDVDAVFFEEMGFADEGRSKSHSHFSAD